jgi:hypothetical protein
MLIEMNLILTGKWAGRVAALLLLLFWGAFFVEHTAEWFLRSDGRYPPTWVFVQHGFHFCMILSLAAMWRWEKPGAIALVASTAAFFGLIGLHRFPFIALLNLIPIAAFSLSWFAARPALR